MSFPSLKIFFSAWILMTSSMVSCAHSPDSVPSEGGQESNNTDGSQENPARVTSDVEPVIAVGDTDAYSDPVDTAMGSDAVAPDALGDDGGDSSGDAREEVNLPPCLPGMAWIPPGPFLSGPNKTETVLPGYCMDLVEVTVGEFNACVADGGCSGMDTWDICTQIDEEVSPNQCVAGRDDYPANYLSWMRSQAYCAWAGKRLPTSEEWEKAARGVDGDLYAWGTGPLTCEMAHQGRGAVFSDCLGYGDLPDRPVPNHFYPKGASPYGLLGTMGNVREWVEFREDTSVLPESGTLGISRGAEYGMGDYALSVLTVDSLLGVTLASQGHGARCAAEPISRDE